MLSGGTDIIKIERTKVLIEKAEREYEIYREREMRLLESDFDKAIKQLKEK